MKSRFAFLAVVSTLLLAGTAQAADSGAWVSTGSYRPKETLVLVNWEISQPLGSFNDYIDTLSLRGFSTEIRSFVRENVSAGVSFSFNRFEKTYDNFSTPITNGNASGPLFRYADMFAIRALAHYYLARGPLMPYIGFGIGGDWAYGYQQIADLSSSQNDFNFIVSPEVGLVYNFATGGTNVGLNLGFRYTYTTATIGTVDNAQWLSGIVGLAWSY